MGGCYSFSRDSTPHTEVPINCDPSQSNSSPSPSPKKQTKGSSKNPFKCFSSKKKKSSSFEPVPTSSAYSSVDDLDAIRKKVYGTFDSSDPAMEYRKGCRTRQESEDFHAQNIRRRLNSLENANPDSSSVEESIIDWFVGNHSVYNQIKSTLFTRGDDSNNNDYDNNHTSSPRKRNRPRLRSRSRSRGSSATGIDDSFASASGRKLQRNSSFRAMFNMDDVDMVDAEDLHSVLKQKFSVEDEYGRHSDFNRFFPLPDSGKNKKRKNHKISLSNSVQLYESHRNWLEFKCTRENMEAAWDKIPKFWAREAGLDNIGRRCIYVQGARFDRNVGTDDYCYAMAYLMRNWFDPTCGGVDHDSDTPEGQVTVLIDCRAGDKNAGYTNPSPIDKQFLNMIKGLNAMLPGHFPGRTCRVIIYPLPTIAVYAWKAIGSMLGEETRKKIVILNGSDRATAPAPLKLGEYVSVDTFLEEDAKKLHSKLEEYVQK